MAVWSRYILPRMIDAGMRNKFMGEHRGRAAPLAQGKVLEIGMGSGLNIPYYGSGVTHLFGLEPSVHLREKAAPLAESALFPVDMIDAGAESIPLETASIDSVVSSWTLCSISGVESALQEIRRVLKPGGKFIFIEHGRAPDAEVSRWQDRLEPLSTRLLGCALNRPMDQMIASAGFKISGLEKAYFEGPRLISYHYIGQAEPLA